MNAADVVALSPLDERSLDALIAGSFHARRIGTVDAAHIALDEGHPTYESANYLWFRQRYGRFMYVDRIVVARAARGKGLAKHLYGDLIERASRDRHKVVVCEVNVEPPNPASDAFHASHGFEEVGRATMLDGAKTVRYLALRIV